MKIRLLALIIFLLPAAVSAQTETTNAMVQKYDGNGIFTLYFYKNTLKMLNQTDSKEFDEMIKGIEKLRFMIIDKTKLNFSLSSYKDLVKGYVSESYEQMMTSRLNGKNFDVYMKDKKGSSLGTIVLVNDSTSLYVMDMIGKIDVNRATKVFSELEKNSDIGNRIQGFLDKGKKKAEEDDSSEKHE